MQIVINGRPVDQLSPSVFKYLSKGKPGDLITGAVMTAEEATAKFQHSSSFLIRFAAAAIGLIVIGANVWSAAYGSKSDQGLALVLGVPGAIIAAVGLRWIYLRRMRLWAERLPERVAALPAAGTMVRLDGAGIAVGSRQSDWPRLRIDLIELSVSGSGEDATLTVERLILAGAPDAIVLDASLIENGQKMIETACRRLLPGPS